MMELKAVVIFACMVALGWAITAKADKQFVDLLEGKLHRLGKPTTRHKARQTYKKHARASSVVAVVGGMGFGFLAFIVTVKPLAIFLGLLGLTLVFLGVLGRVRTFHRAEQELT